MTAVTQGVPARPLLHVREEQASGTAGGTFTAGAWRTRVLNAVVFNAIVGASLASNQITLPAGDFEVLAFAPARSVDHHHARLYDATGAAVLVNGASGVVSSSESTQVVAPVVGRFSLAVPSLVELQHICLTTKATDGLGTARADFATVEVFSEIKLWKVG
jgi:hypothetical protein